MLQISKKLINLLHWILASITKWLFEMICVKDQLYRFLKSCCMNLHQSRKIAPPLLPKTSRAAPMLISDKSKSSKNYALFVSFVVQSKSSLHGVVGWWTSHFSALNFSQHSVAVFFPKRCTLDLFESKTTRSTNPLATMQNKAIFLMIFTSAIILLMLLFPLRIRFELFATKEYI